MRPTILLPLLCIFTPFAFTQTGFPFQDESLHYSVNWPSGLNLGDANLTAHHSVSGWDFQMNLAAGIPGFRLAGQFHSVTNEALCSSELDRDITQGSKKTSDKTTFDYQAGVAHRVSVSGGGTSDLPITPGCAYDALALLYLARRALGQGAIVPQQQVLFGPPYAVTLQYGGAQTITVEGKSSITDRVAVAIKGPSSSTSAEIFFARDAARTPLLARVAAAIGTVSLELAH